MRAALYLRVSTDNQTTENQQRELEAAAERAGWRIVEVLADNGISGSKGRDQRPAFDRLHRLIARRQIDVIMAWSVDRLGRSLQDLVGFLGELRAAGVDLYLHQQGVDTTTPAGRALFQMLGVFAEFERAIIQERIRSGIARARAQGKHLGRPRIDQSIEEATRKRLAEGIGVCRIARELGIGNGTVQRVKLAKGRVAS
jgi:DNA invertase Pin-like site-specific DNA recombinase